MMRVAYDISMLARYYYRPNFEKFGIFRVAEEVLRQFVQRPELEITLVRLCESLAVADPLYEALRYEYYLEDQDWLSCDRLEVFASRVGIWPLYKAVYRTCFDPELPKLGRTRTLAIRLLRKLLFYLQTVDLYQPFEAQRFDLFHSTYLPLPPRPVTQHLPRVLTVYDLIPVLMPEFVTPAIQSSFQAILQSLDSEQDWAICISQYTKQDLCRYLPIAPERVFVAPLAAADYFHPVEDPQILARVRQQYQLPSTYFLSLSSLQPRKNFVHLLTCFEQWLQQHPGSDASLVVVGHAAWTAEAIFATVAASPRLQQRVVFPGHIPDREIAAVYSGAIAFLFPSLYEGFGLPVLEAMQCGVPVIASDRTSVPEVVGAAGILIDPEDPQVWCDQMTRIYQDAALRQQLRHQGQARARQFSWSRCADTVAMVYHEMLKSRP